MTTYGVWVDDAPGRVIKPGYWDQLKAFGFSTGALMLDTTEPGWDPLFTPGQVRQIYDLAVARNIELVLTVWPVPRASVLDAMFDDLERHYLPIGPAALEVDCEGLWQPKYVGGFTDLRKASIHLVNRMDKVRRDHDVRTELTTFAGHPEAQAGCLVSRHVDRVLAQIYSTRNNWRKEAVEWDSRYGPGIRQTKELEKFRKIPADEDGTPPKICVGLAAWDQKWPGHTIGDAMDLAFDAAMEWDPVEVRWWSAKHIWGVQSTGPGDADVRTWFEQWVAH